MKMKFIYSLFFALCVFAAPSYAANIGQLLINPQTQARTPSTYVDIRDFSATIAETATVPAHTTGKRADIVIFSSDCDFYVRKDATAAIPSGDVTDGTGSVFKPVIYLLNGNVSTLSIVPTTADCSVVLEYYMK
jgi:hypothetical protein